MASRVATAQTNLKDQVAKVLEALLQISEGDISQTKMLAREYVAKQDGQQKFLLNAKVQAFINTLNDLDQKCQELKAAYTAELTYENPETSIATALDNFDYMQQVEVLRQLDECYTILLGKAEDVIASKSHATIKLLHTAFTQHEEQRINEPKGLLRYSEKLFEFIHDHPWTSLFLMITIPAGIAALVVFTGGLAAIPGAVGAYFAASYSLSLGMVALGTLVLESLILLVNAMLLLFCHTPKSVLPMQQRRDDHLVESLKNNGGSAPHSDRRSTSGQNNVSTAKVTKDLHLPAIKESKEEEQQSPYDSGHDRVFAKATPPSPPSVLAPDENLRNSPSPTHGTND